MTAKSIRMHATCVDLNGRGVLLRGPSGSGKSDLALRLIAEAGARLVADDQCLLECRGHRLIASAPATIAGCIEARGIGLMRLPVVAETPVALLVDLKPEAAPARLPEPATECICGIEVPRAEIDPFSTSTIAKLRLATGQHGAAIIPAVEAGAGAPADRPQERGAAMHAERDVLPPADARDGKGTTREAYPAGAGQGTAQRLRVVLVTGMSGAGRSTTLKALEDLGYESIDNLPLNLISPIVHEGGLSSPVAVGVDIRTRNFAVRPFLDALKELYADPALDVTLLFVDCEDEVLRRRFTETRRRHPLAQERPLNDGITAERRLVAPLRRRADMTIDTSTLSVPDLRRLVGAQLGLGSDVGMVVFVTSFSYKNGLPREADLVFDVRFLRNPHYEAALRPLTGCDGAVADYVAGDPEYPEFMAGLREMLRRLVPRYEAEGKSYLTIGIGCSGGRHRSVAVAERLAAFLEDQGRCVLLSHRELGPGGDAGDARGADSR